MASLENLKKRNCSQRMSRMSLSIIQIFLQNLVLKSYQHHHYHLLPFFLFLFFFLFSIVIIINIIIIVIRRTFQVIFKELSYHFLFYFALTFFWKCLGIITFTRFENRINHYCWEKKTLRNPSWVVYYENSCLFISILFLYFANNFLSFTKKGTTFASSKFHRYPLIFWEQRTQWYDLFIVLVTDEILKTLFV